MMAHGTGDGTRLLHITKRKTTSSSWTSLLHRWRNHLSPEHGYNAIGGHNSQRRHNSVAAPRIMTAGASGNSVVTAIS